MSETEEDPWGAALAEQSESEKDSGVDEDDPWGAALSEQADSKVEAITSPPKIAPHKGGKDKVDLDVVMDVPITLALEIGRARVSIRSLLSYTQGSVIELDRLAGEPLDVLVNGTLIAHGEVVVVNDKFGVRLTDVVSPIERVKKLR
jgi:flagellar motor switch protein FliN/FliY